jgi:hypothetical protein
MTYSQGFNWGKCPRAIETLKTLSLEGYTSREVTTILSNVFNHNFGYKAIESARLRFGCTKHLLARDKSIKLYETLKLPLGDYLITCDYHSPYHSELWVNRALMIAEIFGLRKHIIAGDLFDMDFAKHWPKKEGEESTELGMTIEQCKPIINMLKYFDETILIRGNHEDRITRMTEARIQARHIIQLISEEIWNKKFKYSYYDKLYIGKDWLVVHPKSYSQLSGSTAIRLAEKYHRHILNAHGHFIAMRYDRSGKHMGIDIGGLFDIKKTAYMNLQTTTHPFWNEGFAVLKNNHVWLFNKSTDWKHWEGQWEME